MDVYASSYGRPLTVMLVSDLLTPLYNTAPLSRLALCRLELVFCQVQSISGSERRRVTAAAANIDN